uniref:Uncharacterized protein n=1 Tax=Anguilla anguilla TaxID=7936 RepID=A0A0E9Q1A0_ANGAN
MDNFGSHLFLTHLSATVLSKPAHLYSCPKLGWSQWANYCGMFRKGG